VCYPTDMIGLVFFLAVALTLQVGKAVRRSRQGGRVASRRRVLDPGRLAGPSRAATGTAGELADAGDPAAPCASSLKNVPHSLRAAPDSLSLALKKFPQQIPVIRSPIGEFAWPINQLEAVRRKQKPTIFPQSREFSQNGRPPRQRGNSGATLKSRLPDLLRLDLMMVETDGLQLVAALPLQGCLRYSRTDGARWLVVAGGKEVGRTMIRRPLCTSCSI
jgi:CheY-like chemotaxis protein